MPRLRMIQPLGQHRQLDFHTSYDSKLWHLPATTATITNIYRLTTVNTVDKSSSY